MSVITAKIIDATHLELGEPISAQPGELIQLAILEEGDDEPLWKAAAKKRFLDAYADEDAIYDNL
jgi:hypothetical protein